MSACQHTSLNVVSQVFTASGEQADEMMIRAAHVKVHCAGCGMPFKFVGVERPQPEDPLDFLKGGGPWASISGDELAAWITPIEVNPFITQAAEGHA